MLNGGQWSSRLQKFQRLEGGGDVFSGGEGEGEGRNILVLVLVLIVSDPSLPYPLHEGGEAVRIAVVASGMQTSFGDVAV